LKKSEDKESTSCKLALTDEYKFGFPYERFYLQTRVKRNGDVKMHLDGGNIVNKLYFKKNTYIYKLNKKI